MDPSEDVMSSVGAVGYSLSGLFPLPESSADVLFDGLDFEITPISMSLGCWVSSSISSSSFASDSAYIK